MAKIEISRNDVSVEIEGTLVLAPRNENIKAYRNLCSELGAVAIFSPEIKTKKDIDFEGERDIIANLNVAKNLPALEKNDSIIAYLVDANSDDFDVILEKTKKPIIAKIRPGDKLDNIKKSNAVFIECVEGTDNEETLDYKLAEKIKKEFQIPIISRSKVITPEEIYGIVRKTECDCVALGDIAFRQPVIFEQATNYTEKGYYNKITRKRREKTAESFEQYYAEQEKQDMAELNKFKNIFMND